MHSRSVDRIGVWLEYILAANKLESVRLVCCSTVVVLGIEGIHLEKSRSFCCAADSYTYLGIETVTAPCGPDVARLLAVSRSCIGNERCTHHELCRVALANEAAVPLIYRPCACGRRIGGVFAVAETGRSIKLKAWICTATVRKINYGFADRVRIV